jgi:hypothetical protein
MVVAGSVVGIVRTREKVSAPQAAMFLLLFTGFGTSNDHIHQLAKHTHIIIFVLLHFSTVFGVAEK